jgi:ribulose 1,5-bisphosphate synthetase/thiazole synthase
MRDLINENARKRTIDFLEHCKHIFVVDVIEKDNIRIFGVFLEWDCIQKEQ